MSRKKRQRSRQPNTLDRMIKRVRRSRNIHQRTWRAACEELVLMPDLRRMLRDYIAEHEALLGPDWAASLLLFMAAERQPRDAAREGALHAPSGALAALCGGGGVHGRPPGAAEW